MTLSGDNFPLRLSLVQHSLNHGLVDLEGVLAEYSNLNEDDKIILESKHLDSQCCVVVSFKPWLI